MVKELISEAWCVLSAPVKRPILWLLVLLLPFFILLPFDRWALQNLRQPQDSTTHKIAQQISKRGDFFSGGISLVCVLLIFGLVLKKRKWMIFALTIILSCAFSGILSLGVRVGSGRPRPSAEAPDGLYGPVFTVNKKKKMAFDYDFQAFPSGHQTTALAAAMPLVVIYPTVGVPVTIASLAVGWSRFQLNRHSPTDLYMGLIFGGIFGYAFGRAGKKLLI